MVVPEGIKSLRDGFFRGGFIENELVFPSTLTSIGSHHEDCVIANTRYIKGCFAKLFGDDRLFCLWQQYN